MPGICLDERERDSEMGLTPAGRGELGGREVHTDRPRSAPGQPGGEVGGAASELDHVQARDIPEDAELMVRDVKDAPGDLVSGPGAVGVLVGVLGVRPGPELPVVSGVTARPRPRFIHVPHHSRP